MIVIGITGGIASGKSTISNMLKKAGIPVIDADEISRDVVKKGSAALEEISKEFGERILNSDGTLNRRALGSIVFSDSRKLEKLNSITHPRIKCLIKEKIIQYKNEGKKLCAVDAPLLIETGFYELVDIVILVYVDRKLQLKRLINRDNITYQQAQKRIESQMSFEEKMKYADYIIDNSRDIEYTKQQINTILNKIILLEDINV